MQVVLRQITSWLLDVVISEKFFRGSATLEALLALGSRTGSETLSSYQANSTFQIVIGVKITNKLRLLI